MSAELRRLIAFSALAAFCAHHWFLLVDSASAWRWIVCVASGLAGALVLVGLRSQRRTVALGGAALVFVAMLAEGLIAVGIPAELLAPGRWDELHAELARGLSGVSEIDTPYNGVDAWTRLGILAAVPLAVSVAMIAAFWPLGTRRVATAVGLAALLALYGTSVTWEAPNGELTRGALLFGLVAAVLWLPGIRVPRLAPALASVALAAAVALPLAARVDASDPLIGYTDWRVFGDDEQITFNWNHTYGALDWPQEGTEVFVATTDTPAYWKTYVLDQFDGAAWTRSSEDFGQTGPNRELAGAPREVVESHPEWIRQFEIRLVALRSRLAVTAGFPLQLDGIEIGDTSGDGTATADQPEIPQGSEYTVTSYIPEPTPGQLRRADGVHPPSAERYTSLTIPQPLNRAEEEIGRPPAIVVAVVPPHGVDQSDRERRSARGVIALQGPSIDQVVKRTPYEEVLELTRRVTEGARTDFEAVSRVQSFLLSSYAYNQDVPLSDDPLPAFLFRDRAGYCQQFAGAMALMLRMSGIPSRVVSGFAPGDRQEGGIYSVSDQDAHSWVEVLYPGIGWVTVDPTPAQTPARTNLVAGPERGTTRLEDLQLGGAFRNRDGRGGGLRAEGQRADPGSEDTGGSPLPFLAFLIVGGGVAAVVNRRRRRLRSPEGAELQLKELRDALAATGMPVTPGATLLAIQGRLSASAGPDAARYAAALSESRYGRRRRKRPGPAERRAFRWALARQAGILGWWKALRAVPPGGPRA